MIETARQYFLFERKFNSIVTNYFVYTQIAYQKIYIILLAIKDFHVKLDRYIIYIINFNEFYFIFPR
jgi:hypothetical protein